MMHFTPEELKNKKIHLVGIKGTGVSALAELLKASGAIVSGTDVDEKFYTDEILKKNGIPFNEGFDKKNISGEIDFVVYSSAYNPDENPELIRAAELNIPALEYTKALGAYSMHRLSAAVSGVHGKTTTTGLAGTLVRELDLKYSVLAGSAVSSFGDKATLIRGDKAFIAETCEYRRHFLDFFPSKMIVTSIEEDHLDYFKNYDDILQAFYEFALKLPAGGSLIYCADDKGAKQLYSRLAAERKDLVFIPYGFTAEGPYRISSFESKDGRTVFRLSGFDCDFVLKIPGRHLVLNAAAALALIADFISDSGTLTVQQLEKVKQAFLFFRGSRRRCEIISEHDGILIIDDYAHHPSAVRTTLAGLKAFYPGRRLIVNFMSHTYSRTAALFDDFAAAFKDADILILNKIYSSAREKYSGGITGLDLFKAAEKHALKDGGSVLYFEEPLDGLDFLKKTVLPGDVFITMGAGDNWKLGRALSAWIEGKKQQ